MTITLTEETIREAEYFGGLGVVYGLYRADPWSAKTKGEWTYVRICCQGVTISYRDAA